MPEAAASPACEEGDLLARQELPASEPEAKLPERLALRHRFASAVRIAKGKYYPPFSSKHSNFNFVVSYPG
jgi:hypothetical protein